MVGMQQFSGLAQSTLILEGGRWQCSGLAQSPILQGGQVEIFWSGPIHSDPQGWTGGNLLVWPNQLYSSWVGMFNFVDWPSLWSSRVGRWQCSGLAQSLILQGGQVAIFWTGPVSDPPGWAGGNLATITLDTPPLSTSPLLIILM